MTSVTPISEFFTAGGTLPPDAPSYVKRPTDEELYQKVRAGEFCYVLTPRQMGKSSLMIRTSRRLSEEGVKSAIVDLTQIGTVESEDQWYKGILSQIRRRLRMSLDPVTWWEQKRDIPNIQKFIEFFEAALVEVKEHVVIFMDEIDTTLKLEFRDNFFAGIRAIYNGRAENPDLRRVTFVLLGVASPSDLIKDRSRTPFNIGQEVSLKPFSREDARMLEQGLEATYPGQAQHILNRVFHWTNGHPYLTQKVCQSVVDHPLPEYDNDRIDSLVESLFISEEASRETNLQFVRDTILYYPDRREILSLYKKVLKGKEIRDNKNSVTQNHLKLAGLVRVDDGRLVVSNNIYARVFDVAWVDRYTEVNWSRRISIALGVTLVLIMSVLIYNNIYLPSKFDRAKEDLPNPNHKSIQALAEMFRMRPALVANDYEYKAKDQFFNYLARQDQVNLIEIGSYEGKPLDDPHFRENYETVVRGLYTSLADVDGTGQSTELLEGMKASLERFHMQGDPLYVEISSWVEARRNSSGGDTNSALVNYDQAIVNNPSNPATQFERARMLSRNPSTYADALKGYNAILSIVPVSDYEPKAGPASMGTSEAQETPKITTAASVPAGMTPVSQNTSATGTVENTTQLAGSATQALSTNSLLPFQSRFMTKGQWRAAVKNDILQNTALYAFYVQAESGSYPSLLEIIPIQIETPSSATENFNVPITPVTTFVPGMTITHNIVIGETLLQISRCYGANFNAVVSANPQILDPNVIFAERNTVKVPNIGSDGAIYGPPCMEFYTVVSGDTWQSIANKFNADVTILQEANPGVTLSVGVKINVPMNSAQSISSTNPPPTNPTVTSCGGTELGGYCWYWGKANISCDMVCGLHGGYNEATSTYAGSKGSSEDCKKVLMALNITLDDFYETKQGGLGCFTIQLTSGNYGGFWDEHPTTADATYSVPGRQRVCACQR